MIRLRGISFEFPDSPPLFSNLNFILRYKEKVGITGPNGCGKTTLFNIIMGFIKVPSGSVEVFGEIRKTEKDFQLVRGRIGYLFQNSDDQLFCPSVREEIAFGLLNFRVPREEIAQRIRESLSLVGLENFEERAPYRLSDGEKRRLALATVIALKPEVLLLDEPTNGIDEEGIKRIEKIIKMTNSAIIISQDVEFLKKTIQVVYTFKDGDVVKGWR